jgi:hypothetical protein
MHSNSNDIAPGRAAKAGRGRSRFGNAYFAAASC